MTKTIKELKKGVAEKAALDAAWVAAWEAIALSEREARAAKKAYEAALREEK